MIISTDAEKASDKNQHPFMVKNTPESRHRGITSHRSEWPSSKNLQINAGEDVVKREPSCTTGGNVN